MILGMTIIAVMKCVVDCSPLTEYPRTLLQVARHHLHQAAFKGRIDLLRVCIAHGADVNARTQGW